MSEERTCEWAVDPSDYNWVINSHPLDASLTWVALHRDDVTDVPYCQQCGGRIVVKETINE